MNIKTNMKKTTKVYDVFVKCANCGFFGGITVVSGRLLIDEECPKCGNQTLGRISAKDKHELNY